MVPDESSLDRFLRTRGGVFAGVYGNLVANRIQLAVGAALSAIGFSMLAVGFAVPALHGLFFGAIGPLGAGVINVVVSLTVRRRLDRTPLPKAELSPEARTLLTSLLKSFTVRQYSGAWMMGGMSGMGTMGSWNGRHQGMMGLDPWTGHATKPLPERAMNQLESAAAAYNRISALAEVGGSGNTSLSKMVPRIVQAADDAMAEVLHFVAVSAKYPEAEGPTQQRINLVIARMEELASRSDTVFGQEPTVVSHRPATSSMDEVLEELRFEGLARQELGQEPETESRLNAS
jgi:hypothetical protein